MTIRQIIEYAIWPCSTMHEFRDTYFAVREALIDHATREWELLLPQLASFYKDITVHTKKCKRDTSMEAAIKADLDSLQTIQEANGLDRYVVTI